MKPYKQIKIGDVYRNPVTGTEWYVTDKDDDEKLIKVAMLCHDGNFSHADIWKKNADRMFTFPCVLAGY